MSDTKDGSPPTIPVRPMDVTAARLTSAWAALMTGKHIQIVYDGAPSAGGQLTLGAKGQGRTVTQVVIPADTRAKPPRMASIRIQIGLRSSEHSLADYAAAFWSESSVEKFVVPYLSALGGPRALDLLDALDAAWNRYDPERRVFALLLRGQPPSTGFLDALDLLDVLYLDLESTQKIASLRAFRSTNACSRPRTPSSVLLELPPSQGPIVDGGGAVPTENQLRIMAEWVSALRTDPGYFIYDPAKEGFRAPVAACPSALEDGSVVIPAYTARTRADRPLPDMVTLIPDNVDNAQPVQFPADEGDAAFWTSGAVSKVMIPYYAMAYGAEALGILADIYQVWQGQATPAQSESGYTGPGVYGLVHLPRSDWGYETTNAFVPGIPESLYTVVVGPGGGTQMRLFSEARDRLR